MARSNRDEELAGLRHPPLDPAAPVGVPALDQRLLKLGRACEIVVESPRDRFDVAAKPGREHAAEILAHALRIIDRAFEQLPLGALRQGIEETELLDIALQLADRLALGNKGVAE